MGSAEGDPARRGVELGLPSDFTGDVPRAGDEAKKEENGLMRASLPEVATILSCVCLPTGREVGKDREIWVEEIST